MSVSTFVPASEKQVSFIKSLAGERGVVLDNLDALSKSDASALIEQLLATPKLGAVVEVGMYQTADGEVFRVQRSRESGNLYAKRLNLIGGGFEYVAGAIRSIRATDRMTLADAMALGVATGVCCVCGRELSDSDSVARGIGPVCAGRV